MPRLLSVGALVLRCSRRADKEGDEHIQTDEWKSLISEAVGELYELAIRVGLRIRSGTQTIAATSGTSSYTLPADHMETLAVEYVDGGGRRWPLRESSIHQRNEHMATGLASSAQRAEHYAIVDSAIELLPSPSDGQYEHIYVMQPPDLSSAADEDEVDLFHTSGERFVIWQVAMVAKDKGEVDLATAERQVKKAEARFTEWAQGQRSTIAPKSLYSADVETYGSSGCGGRLW